MVFFEILLRSLQNACLNMQGAAMCRDISVLIACLKPIFAMHSRIIATRVRIAGG